MRKGTVSKKRKKTPEPVDEATLSLKAGAVEAILKAAGQYGQGTEMTDENMISALIIAVVIWTKAALASGHYDIDDKEARDELKRLLFFAYDECQTEKASLQ